MQSRRIFLKSGAAAMLSLGFAPSFLARAAAAASPRRRLLIAIFQRGAVDGLNMIVPFGDPDYARLRPSIAIARPSVSGAGAVDLDGFFGLHPRMAALGPFWTDKSLAIVHACGSPDASRSHFDAQDYMETATPGVKATRDGWLNRYLGATGEQLPLRGVAVARQMPRSLQGKAPALAFPGVDAFALRGGAGAGQSLEATYTEGRDALLAANAKDAFSAMRIVSAATAEPYKPANGVEYPRSPFGRALQEVARLAKADIGLEVAFAESTGWDHHVNEGAADGQLAGRLDDLSTGIAALARDLGERMADTIILTMSEFGRAARENGNGGTDHGHGNAMMLLGGTVKGGQVYGRWPGLSDAQRFESRDLAVTTDFRDVFIEVVERHLGATPDALGRIFPAYTRAQTPGAIRA